MEKEIKLEPLAWFVERELNYKPKHFVQTNTPLTVESRKWIYEKLVGRFVVITTNLDFLSDLDITTPVQVSDYYGRYPAFEDPKEALLYELTWA